jgi:hypothetical protein
MLYIGVLFQRMSGCKSRCDWVSSCLLVCCNVCLTHLALCIGMLMTSWGSSVQVHCSGAIFAVRQVQGFKCSAILTKLRARAHTHTYTHTHTHMHTYTHNSHNHIHRIWTVSTLAGPAYGSKCAPCGSLHYCTAGHWWVCCWSLCICRVARTVYIHRT